MLSTEVAVLKTNLTWMRETVDAIRESTAEMANYAKQLVRLETEGNEVKSALTRAFISIESEQKARQSADDQLSATLTLCAKDSNERLEAIENEMPLLKLAKSIVFGGVLLILTNSAALVWAVFKLTHN